MAIKDKTLIILGAGSSFPYGFPIGSDLIRHVSSSYISALEGGREHLLFSNSEDIQKIRDEAINLSDLIAYFKPTSIDSFLMHHGSEYPYIIEPAKKLILHTILLQERVSYIQNPPEGWYNLLYEAIFYGTTAKELIEGELPFKVVTFNYDVSLEYYLFTRIMKSGAFSESEKFAILGKLSSSIHHVYGQVRRYKWQGGEADNHEYDLTPPPGSKQDKTKIVWKRIHQDYNNIHLISEERCQNLPDEYYDFLKEVKRIYLLGYGFDQTNNELLFRDILANRRNAHKPFGIIYTNYPPRLKISEAVTQFCYGMDRFKESQKKIHEALASDFSLT